MPGQFGQSGQSRTSRCAHYPWNWNAFIYTPVIAQPGTTEEKARLPSAKYENISGLTCFHRQVFRKSNNRTTVYLVLFTILTMLLASKTN